MAVQDFVELIVSFVREHQGWAAPIAFGVAFAESFCFFSLFWPGTAILVGISALLAASGIDIQVLTPAIIAAGLGGTLGYAISYWIGHHFKDSIPNVWPFRTHPHLIPQGEEFFRKYGAWSVFFGHFFGPVRAVIPVIAGMFHAPQIPFQIANIVSAFIWAAGVIAPAYFLVTFKEEVFGFILQYEWLIAIVMFAAAFLNSLPMALMAIPTLIVFVGLGLLHLYAGGNPYLLLAAGALGAFLGDVYSYAQGRARSADFHAIWPSGWGQAAADRARDFMSRWGAFGLIPSKFHTTLRAFAAKAAGAASMPGVPFAIASSVSALLWAAVLLSPRYILQYFGW